MGSPSPPEVTAEDLVAVAARQPGSGFYVVLQGPDGPTAHLGPYANRDVAKRDAALVRRFVDAILRQARTSAAIPPLPLPDTVAVV